MWGPHHIQVCLFGPSCTIRRFYVSLSDFNICLSTLVNGLYLRYQSPWFLYPATFCLDFKFCRSAKPIVNLYLAFPSPGGNFLVSCNLPPKRSLTIPVVCPEHLKGRSGLILVYCILCESLPFFQSYDLDLSLGVSFLSVPRSFKDWLRRLKLQGLSKRTGSCLFPKPLVSDLWNESLNFTASVSPS